MQISFDIKNILIKSDYDSLILENKVICVRKYTYFIVKGKNINIFERRNYMKEWFIRICCVFLGVAITLGTTKIMSFFDTDKEPAVAETTVDEYPVPTVAEVAVIEEEPVEEDKEQKFLDEAQQKFQEFIDGVEEVVGEPEVTEPVEEIPANSIEAAPVKWKRDYPMINSKSTLQEKLAERSSYEETMTVNAFDKIIIDNSKIDFSDVKISIIGDSITAGNTLPEDEQGVYDWPSQLKEILGCKEVVNLGIGGSTVSSCIDHFPMCERWFDIKPDSDIIIVMGGSNDMLFMDKWQFGNLEYDLRMNKDTFCGDLDRMLSAMRWTFIDHNEENYCKFLYINPPSTILNDAVVAVNPENMVKQETFAEAINVIAPTYGFEVIDMYNNNILNSHDPDINAIYVTDGIHCNKEGYRILAEHVASQIIQRIEQ